MKKKINTLILIALIFYSCNNVNTNDIADLIITSDAIYSMDSVNTVYTGVAIKNGKIMAVGTHEEVHHYKGAETQIIELNDRIMYPGFIEGHAHIMGVGENLINLDLMNTTSFEEIIEKVKEKAQNTPKGTWIVGRGWHQDKWKTVPEKMFKGFPTHDLLSNAVPNHPVFLKHASGHASLVNKNAMDLANITKKSLDPEGGEIFKDMSGNPSGILNETASELIYQILPANDSTYKRKVLDLAIKSCLENGITSFHEAGSDKDDIDAYQYFEKQNLLKVRLYVMLNGRDENLLNDYFSKGPQINPEGFLTIRSVKLYGDGALGSRGAWLLEPYSDAPNTVGMNVTPMDYLERITFKSVQSGFQVCTHAIGDRGVREILNIYEKALQQNTDLQDIRFRIEHAQHINSNDLPRFKTLGVIPAMQAIHLSSDRPWAIDRLGKERIEDGAYVWQKLLQQGTKVVNGSDAPVEPINPIASIYASVTRKTLDGKPENGYEPSQKMTMEQTLRSYTVDAAYGAFEEKIKGSIEVGKLADFTILDKDLFKITEDKILDTKVKMTIVNGEVVYRAKN